MCQGTNYEMSCGDTLSHFETRCPRNCEVADGPTHYIHDTCAKCDPGYLTHDVKLSHDALLAQLNAQLDVDDQEGQVEGLRARLEKMRILRTATNLAVGKVSHQHHSSVEVEFPITREPKGTSKWVDGKCVWTEEEEKMKRLDRALNHAHAMAVSKNYLAKARGEPRVVTDETVYGTAGRGRRSTRSTREVPRPRVEHRLEDAIENAEREYEQRLKLQRLPPPGPQVHHLRRTKKYASWLGDNGDDAGASAGPSSSSSSTSSSQVTVKPADYHGDSDTGSEETVVPISHGRHSRGAKGDDEFEEDMWVRLADNEDKGKGSGGSSTAPRSIIM